MDSFLHKFGLYNNLEVVTTCLGGEEIQYFSKRGIPNWDEISQAIQLLAQVIELKAGWQVLVLGSDPGAIGVFLAKRVHPGDVWLADTNFLAKSLAAQTLEVNRATNAHLNEGYTSPTSQDGLFDCTVELLPKGRKFARRRLVEAWASLRTGGAFYLAGSNGEGIQSVIRDAEELFGLATILGYKKGNRVAKFVKSTHNHPLPGWSLEPGIARNTWFEFEAEIAGENCTLASLPGVFSYDRVDPGSKLLLSCMEVEPDDRVLDLGCGWGLLGLSAAKLGAEQVDLVDVDLQGVAASQENIRRLNLPNIRALASDITSSVRNESYDLVVTNPPFHAGKSVDFIVAHAFISQAHQLLRPGGRLLLVANHFIRYEKLMREVYRQAILVLDDRHYQVWSALI